MGPSAGKSTTCQAFSSSPHDASHTAGRSHTTPIGPAGFGLPPSPRSSSFIPNRELCQPARPRFRWEVLRRGPNATHDVGSDLVVLCFEGVTIQLQEKFHLQFAQPVAKFRIAAANTVPQDRHRGTRCAALGPPSRAPAPAWWQKLNSSGTAAAAGLHAQLAEARLGEYTYSLKIT